MDTDMTLAEPVQITTLIAFLLDKLKIPYYIVGSLASSLYGIPRATADVDLIADIGQHHIRSLVESLQKDFYVDEERIQISVRARSSFNVIHLETMFKIDIFLAQNDEFSKEEMARREKYQVVEEKGQELYLASAEDIILGKLHWYKSGGGVSERQWNDVLGVLRVPFYRYADVKIRGSGDYLGKTSYKKIDKWMVIFCFHSSKGRVYLKRDDLEVLVVGGNYEKL